MIDKPVHLTPREIETLQLMCAGAKRADIAVRMGISADTVNNNRTALLRKTESRSSAQLGVWAQRNGYVREEPIVISPESRRARASKNEPAQRQL